MEVDTQEVGEWRPPYLSYTTFTNFIKHKCSEQPLPPEIDRTFIDKVAGGVQPQLLSALRAVGLTEGENNKVQGLLKEAVESDKHLKRVLKNWAVEFYSEQIGLAETNNTAQVLWNSFDRSGYTGSTLRKAIVFYLALTDDVGLPKSPHFKPPKQARSSKKKPTGDAGGIEKPLDDPPPPPPPANNNSQSKMVQLRSGGSVTVSYDANLFDTSDEDQQFVMDLIAKLRSYTAARELPRAGTIAKDETVDD